MVESECYYEVRMVWQKFQITDLIYNFIKRLKLPQSNLFSFVTMKWDEMRYVTVNYFYIVYILWPSQMLCSFQVTYKVNKNEQFWLGGFWVSIFFIVLENLIQQRSGTWFYFYWVLFSTYFNPRICILDCKYALKRVQMWQVITLFRARARKQLLYNKRFIQRKIV